MTRINLTGVLDVNIRDFSVRDWRKTTLIINTESGPVEISLVPGVDETSVAIHDERK